MHMHVYIFSQFSHNIAFVAMVDPYFNPIPNIDLYTVRGGRRDNGSRLLQGFHWLFSKFVK